MNNIKYLAIIAGLLLGMFFVRFVRAEEVGGTVSVSMTENGVALTAAPTQSVSDVAAEAGRKAAAAIRVAEAQAQERAANAARRAGLTFWQARSEDAGKIWNGTKWVSCQVGRGVTNADGYVAAAVAVPAGYVAGSAFSAAESCRTSAASIR